MQINGMSEAVGLSIGIYYRNIRFLRTSEYIDIKQKEKNLYIHLVLILTVITDFLINKIF